ncbi:hypothetical protein [Vibrio mediterranei]|uniref:hypothetical protein n=1 Tax=Vibrio mediterranei TaxID=689 RepID=UPI002283F85B|nr:hypothetical protein [Vibrio mediterranei]MCY9853995.1 hypothetical protein [Vibrio mediterranei]
MQPDMMHTNEEIEAMAIELASLQQIPLVEQTESQTMRMCELAESLLPYQRGTPKPIEE